MGIAQDTLERLREENDRIAEENVALKSQLEDKTNCNLDLVASLKSAQRISDQIRNAMTNETQAHNVCKLNLARSYTRIDYLQNELTQFERYKETYPACHVRPLVAPEVLDREAKELHEANKSLQVELGKTCNDLHDATMRAERLAKRSRDQLATIYSLNKQIDDLTASSDAARAELADRQHEFKWASNAKAENVNLVTKIAMLEAKLKTYDGVAPAFKPSDIILLDQRPSRETARMSPEQQNELKSRLSGLTKKLEIAAQKLGHQAIALEAYRKFEKEINAELEPFKSAAQGNEWVFGFLVRHPNTRGPKLFFHERRWHMTWYTDSSGFKVIVKAENLKDLNKVVHEKLLEEMPEPTIPEFKGTPEQLAQYLKACSPRNTEHATDA